MIFQNLKKILVITLVVCLTKVPDLLAANNQIELREKATINKMISTSEWVGAETRTQMEEKVQNFLSRSEAQNQLKSLGVDPSEAKLRVASLSDEELNKLSTEIDKNQYAGDIGGILIVVLLVVLIIYLVKRI